MEKESNLYDERIQCSEITMLKTALPYFQPTLQKNLSFFIAALQFKKTMEYFNNPNNTMKLVAMEQHANSQTDLLLALRNVCPKEEQEQLDQILNMLQIISAYDILFHQE